MPVSAKICGISTSDALDAAVAGGASHIGFVLFPKSPRDIPVERAAPLARRLPGRVTPVAVLVDPDDGLLLRARDAGMRALQLHGNETPERVAAAKVRPRVARDRRH